MDDDGRTRAQREDSSAHAVELADAGFDDAREVGRGGFGIVYRCRQTALERDVAVKVLDIDRGQSISELPGKDFVEQRVMGRLTGHPHIIDVLEVGATASGRSFIVMPYFVHGSLDARLRRHGSLSVAEVLRIGVKLCGAVAMAHFHGVVHGDLTPANILVSNYGEPVLSDFGISHILGQGKPGEYLVAGSPAFIAPELFGGAPPTPASDVYGLGAVLYCALAAHTPFPRRAGETVADQVRRIMSESALDLETEFGIPADVSAMIGSAMARQPENRPTATALGKQIQLIQAGMGLPVDEMALFTESDDRSLSLRAGRPSEVLVSRISTRDGNLPLELTSFVDRRSEVAEGRKHLGIRRLVTLTGIGGVGKTRLALRIAEKSRSTFPDGVWLVELADLFDGALVAEVFVSALGLRAQPKQSPFDVLTGFLESRHILLVLDNCEHIVDQVASLVVVLLQRCPELRILATSREALDVDGEAVLLVPPLPVPGDCVSAAEMPTYDATTLFVERATAAVPGFSITEENYPTVARICTVLDGLPLAIELAAARMKSLSLNQIAERLVRRYTLLSRGLRDAPQRQQSLRSAVDWSYELCTVTEQRVWVRMSVFAGSFELEAAEEVLGEDMTPIEVLDAVSSLVDKSILIREESDRAVRFRMLYAVRDYGREKLDEDDEISHWCQRHQGWSIALARRLDEAWLSDRQRPLIEQVSRELPNLREALAFTMAEPDQGDGTFLRFVNTMYRFWLAHGMTDEGHRWVERALSRSAETGYDTVELACALNSRSAWVCLQGDLDGGAVIVNRLNEIDSENPNLLWVHAYATRADGLYSLFADDPPRARSLLQESLGAFVRIGDICSEVEVVLPLGWAHILCADPSSALGCFEQATIITQARGEVVYRSHALLGAGVALWRLGRSSEADEALRQGLRLARSRGDPFIASMCMESMAWVANRGGDGMRTAMLLAVAEGIVRVAGSTTSTVLFPALAPHHEECVRDVLQALGVDAVAKVHRETASWGLEVAAAYALEEAPEVDSADDDPLSELTRREQEVAALVADGLTNKAIASKLVISQRTVGGHVEHILVKLGLSSRTQIAAWVVRAQKVRSDDSM